MLIEKVKKYRNREEYDLNCAETIVYAANEEYNLNLDQNTFKSAAAFGGGMGIEDICGAITGSLMVLGILYIKEKAHESEEVKLLSQAFFGKFEEKLGTINCKELKEKYRDEQTGCDDIIFTAAEILNEIVTNKKQSEGGE